MIVSSSWALPLTLLLLALSSNVRLATPFVVPAARPSKITLPWVHIVCRETSAAPITLFLAKAKRGTGITKAGGKIQVKLLKHVAGTGQAGDVILVSPAFFENKLKKTKSAVVVSDRAVADERKQKASKEKEQKEAALSVQEKLKDMTLTISKKAGPDGQLFGGIGPKVLLEELRKKLPMGALDGKQIKVKDIKDEEGKNLGHDIKHVGDFTVTIALLNDVDAKVEISVVGE